MRGNKAVAVNRKARFNYTILETCEAGVSLVGTEVKSLRAGRASLVDGFARVKGNEIFLFNVHIPTYEEAGPDNHDPRRTRKLLMHRPEISRLVGKISQKGLTLIPLRIYFKRGKAKIELALAEGKRKYDKREAIKKRQAQREAARALRVRTR